MATVEEIARLILEADVKGFTEAQAKITNVKAALDTLTAGYKSGAVNIDEYMKQGTKLQAELDDITAGYKAAGEAAKKYGSNAAAAAALAEKATATATNKLAGLGQAGLQTGRVIQDFAQGGVAGVLNNIEGLTQAIGGGAGLAGVLTILGTAFFVLKPIVAEFMKSLAPEPVVGFQGAIETLQARIKELTDKPVKLSADIKELENAKEQIDDIKKGLDALEAAKSGRTVGEKAAGDQFRKQFDETGGEGKEALEAVQRQAGEAAVANDPVVRKQRKAIADRERSQKAAERAQKEAEQKATEAMGMPGADPAYLAQLAQKAGSLKKEADAFGDPTEMAKLRDNLKRAVGDAKMKSDKEVGKTFENVTKGNSPIARDALAEQFRAAGQDKFAGIVEASSPEAMAAKQAKEQAAAQSAGLDAHNAEQSRAGLKAANKQALAERERAGQLAEQDPETKAEFARINKTFGGFGQVGVDASQAARNAAAARQKEIEKAQKADKAELLPSAVAAAQETQMIMRENMGITRAMANQIQQMRAENRRLAADARQVRQFMQQPGPTNLPGGQ